VGIELWNQTKKVEEETRRVLPWTWNYSNIYSTYILFHQGQKHLKKDK